MKKILYFIFFFILLLLNLSFYYFSPPKKLSLNTIPFKIIISGSTSTYNLCNDLGNEFSKLYPNISIIKTGSGSSEAVLSVKNNSSHIGDLSRQLTNKENPNYFNSHIIAKDIICVCTNKNNTVDNISFSNLQKIFQRKITNWKQLGGENKNIILIGRDSASGTKASFEEHLNLKENINYDVEFENNGKVKYKIQNDADSIGFISLNAVDDSLNVVKIDGFSPTIENVINSNYHITHPLLQITKKDSKDSILDAWFSFVYSDKGAAILKQNRFIPVPKN